VASVAPKQASAAARSMGRMTIDLERAMAEAS
jgi:hypothetical protein